VGNDTSNSKFKHLGNNKLLICQMTARNEVEGFIKPAWSFWEVLENLLSIINIHNETTKDPMKSLIHNSSLILARLMEELVSHASGAYVRLA
jgi:hypothetical protein